MRKHNIENFEFIIICVCKKEELGVLERKYIEEFNTFGRSGYNMTSGGEGRRDGLCSEETRKKISNANTGRVPTQETRQKISKSNMGHGASEATREKLRRAATGVIKLPETIEKLRASMKNRIIKASTREKISLSHLGKSKSVDHVKKIKENKRKICDETVTYIRKNPDKLKQTELALKFNISKISVFNIIHRKTYND